MRHLTIPTKKACVSGQDSDELEHLPSLRLHCLPKKIVNSQTAPSEDRPHLVDIVQVDQWL